MSPTISTPTEAFEAMKAWWQGDCVLEGQHFAYRINPGIPLTVESQAWVSSFPGNPLVEVTIPEGLMVISQTCDIRRDLASRPYIEVAPLVVVPEKDWGGVIQGRRPRYVTVRPLHAQHLAADLDRVFTVEKAEVATWTRTPGELTDEETHSLSYHLAQKRGRPALPEDFEILMAPLIERWKNKKSKQTEEGATIRDIAEVRVQASPHWYAVKVRLDFWFILEEGTPIQDRLALKSQWLNLLDIGGRFGPIDGHFTYLDLMKVSSYKDSDEVGTERVSI